MEIKEIIELKGKLDKLPSLETSEVYQLNCHKCGKFIGFLVIGEYDYFSAFCEDCAKAKVQEKEDLDNLVKYIKTFDFEKAAKEDAWDTIIRNKIIIEWLKEDKGNFKKLKAEFDKIYCEERDKNENDDAN